MPFSLLISYFSLVQGRRLQHPLRSSFCETVKGSWMDLGENSWSMVKREVTSSPGSPADHSYLQGDRRDRHTSEELRSPAPPQTHLDTVGTRRTEGRSLHSYVHFGHHNTALPSSEDITLFTDLDQGNKLIISGGAHKSGLIVDPSDMYQTLAIAAAQTQAGYDSPTASYMHSNPNSPVYVPTSRVGPMIPSLPYLQSNVSSQPSHPVNSHPVWSQPTPESPSYSTGSPHTSNRFHYSPSPPMNNGTSRDSSYSSPLNVNSRDQYNLTRPIGGSYASPYGGYVAPQLSQLSTPWPGGPFENSMLHSLQTRGASLSIRGPNGGMYWHISLLFTSSHETSIALISIISPEIVWVGYYISAFYAHYSHSLALKNKQTNQSEMSYEFRLPKIGKNYK